MKNYVILAVTPDKYELPIAIFENYKEMQKWVNKPYKYCTRIVCMKETNRLNKCKFVKVNLKECENEL